MLHEKNSPKTVVELFAGVGGFRFGLERSTLGTIYLPWKTVYANQWEPGKKRQDAFECYLTHFGDTGTICSNEDINTVDKSSIPNHTLLVGGFPCQDYSVAATGTKGIKGKKGALWWDVYATLEAKHPPFVLLENVDRLLKSPARQRGRDFAIMLTSFWKLGYAVEWRVVNAADYGFVQRRRRTFIFAYKIDTDFSRIQKKYSSEDILSTEGYFANTFPVEITMPVKAGELGTTDLKKISDTFCFLFEAGGYMRDGLFWTTKIKSVYHGKYTVLKNIMDHNVATEFFLGHKIAKWDYQKGPKHILRRASNGHQYMYSEGPIAFPDSINKPARTMLTSEATMNRSTHVVCDLDCHELRLLTPEEAEAIQGFPKGWTNTGMSKRFRYFCMGNALVTGCVTIMGVALNHILLGQSIKGAYKEAFKLLQYFRMKDGIGQIETAKDDKLEILVDKYPKFEADSLEEKEISKKIRDVYYRRAHTHAIEDCLTYQQKENILGALAREEQKYIESLYSIKLKRLSEGEKKTKFILNTTNEFLFDDVQFKCVRDLI